MNAYDERSRAKRLMRHYITMLMRAQGLAVDSDITSELDELVDCMIDAAMKETKAEVQKVQR